MLTIEPTGEQDSGPCACCGDNSRRAWGLVRDESNAHAAYFVHWTLGGVETHGATFDLVLGTWGEGTTAEDRCGVRLAYRLMSNGPAFMVADAKPHDHPKPLYAQARSRAELVGTPLAGQAFAIVDAVLAQDPRIAELLGGWRFEA